MTPKFNFTKALLDTVVCPETLNRLHIYDRATPGLTFCVTRKAARSFYFYRFILGRPRRVRLGGWPDLSIEQARKLAVEFNADIARGIDPTARRQAARNAITFANLFAHYMEHHAIPHKKSWRIDQANYDNHIQARWAGRKASSIDRGEVQRLVNRVGQAAGPIAANRVWGLVSVVFNVGRGAGLCGDNPATGVKLFKERSRDRFLHADELPLFFAALDAESELLRDFFVIALFTGARRSNVQAMTWLNIDLGRGTWTIPETKTGDSLTVHLAPPVVEVLQRRQGKRRGPWVFASPGNETGHLTEPKGAWRRILKRAGLLALLAKAGEGSEQRDFLELVFDGPHSPATIHGLTWERVDLRRGLWQRGRQPMPLSARAREILTRRAQSGDPDGGGRVFPGLTAADLEAAQEAGLKDLRIHDLRRTFGSWQAATGASLPVIGKSLGHTQASTTAIYARLDLEPIRSAVNKAAEAMLKAGRVGDGGQAEAKTA